jgi:hypothetical protein
MTTTISMSDAGIIVIHDPHDAILDLERAMRHVGNVWCRQRYLAIASLVAHGEYLPPASAVAKPMATSAVPTVVEIERWAVPLAALGLRLGDDHMFRIVAVYAGLRTLAEQAVLADLLLRPGLTVVNNAVAAEHPIAYLLGAVRLQIAEGGYEPQERMVKLNDGLAGSAVTATSGVDVSHYVGTLRATGRASDRKLAATIWATARGASKEDVGDAAYQAMRYHFRQPRAKAIARRAREPFPRATGNGVMTPLGWFYTIGRRVDSVWHTANSHLLRGV